MLTAISFIQFRDNKQIHGLELVKFAFLFYTEICTDYLYAYVCNIWALFSCSILWNSIKIYASSSIMWIVFLWT